jgi:hypothetical protein
METTLRRLSYLAVVSLTSILTLANSAQATPVVFSIGGDNTTASIQTTVDNFRAAIGNPNNGNGAGDLGSGRREINWDGGATNITTPAPGGTPFNVFLNNRGAQFTTPGTGFTQAVPGADIAGNATYSTTFGVFSQSRLFTPLGSNITDGTFFIPGTNGGAGAFVSAFGAVFTDVDSATSSKIDYFDVNGNLLTSVFVPAGTTANGSLSFLGVLFNAGERIGRVHITSGNVAPGPNDSLGVDVVVMDDFIFSEPRRIPEPAAGQLALFGILVLAGGFALRRSQQ